MTADEFRRIALSLSGAIEKSHQRHPDFRANNKIFASLGYPDETFGTVKLTPEQQREFVQLHATVFTPVKGAWGLQGSTLVHLAAGDSETIGEALTAAWRNVQTKTKPKKKR
jgi:hypothetical protein